MSRPFLGLALGGGGIKAFSQVGALKVMRDIPLKFDVFSGTSMGSIIATLCAAEVDLSAIEALVLKLEEDILKQKLLKVSNVQVFPLITQHVTGLIQPDVFVDLLREAFKPYRLHQLNDVEKPMVISSVDLISGKMVYFTNRKAWFKSSNAYLLIDDATVLEAIQASCSFPMVFETMNFRDLQLVDGGVLLNLPVEPLKAMDIDHVISISMESLPPFKHTKKVSELGSRIVDLVASDAVRRNLNQSDYHLNIYDRNIGIFSFGKGQKAISLGEQVALEHRSALAQLKFKRKRFFF